MVNVTGKLDTSAGCDCDAVLRSNSASGHQHHWYGQADSTWTRDDEDCNRVSQGRHNRVRPPFVFKDPFNCHLNGECSKGKKDDDRNKPSSDTIGYLATLRRRDQSLIGHFSDLADCVSAR